MLQMECPACDVIISSPFLAEIDSVSCRKCETDVLVKDIFVSTRAFTMDRDVLLRRVTHYRILLKQIERELSQTRASSDEEGNGNNSLERLYLSLQELMTGARGNYRLALPNDLSLDMEMAGRTCNGRLVNLSTKGAAIRVQDMPQRPKNGEKILLRTTLPENQGPLLIDGSIAWMSNRDPKEVRYNATLGISFFNLAGAQHRQIWEYLINAQVTVS